MRDINITERYEAFVPASTMEKQIKAGAPVGYADALKRAGGGVKLLEKGSKGLQTLQPLSSWMLYGPLQHNYTRRFWRNEYEIIEVFGGEEEDG